MIGIQIVAIVFAILMMYFTYLHYRRQEFRKIEWVLWQILWIGLVFVVLFPQSVSFILETFSISRTFDLVVIVGIMISLGIAFRNYVIIQRLERRIEDSVREDALKKFSP